MKVVQITMKLLKFGVVSWSGNYMTFLGTLLLFCCYFVQVTSQGSGRHKEPSFLPTSSQDGSISRSQIELNRSNSKYKLYPKSRRDPDKTRISSSTATSSPDATTTPEVLTQLFTKWMSYDTTTKTEDISSRSSSIQTTASAVINRLSSQAKEWLSKFLTQSQDSSPRTFLLGPLITAIPLMAFEIFALGGVGLMIPASLLLFVLGLPLLAVAFIILI